jgi:sialate O-acetylesterase
MACPRRTALQARDKTAVKPFRLSLLALALLPGLPSRADVLPAPIISEGMVLQRGRRAVLWGMAEPGEKIRIDFRDRSYNVVADAEGRWRAAIQPGEPGGPFVLDFTADNAVEIANVWVGDVWLCSGQSNMVWPVQRSLGAERIGPASANRRIRLLTVGRDGALSGWKPAGPETILPFSAVGYYFGREIEATQRVPVGLIHAAVGGTAIELWMPRVLVPEVAGVRGTPGEHFERMIRPLQPYSLRGALWYQGEANAARAADYERLFTAMIRAWRRGWENPALPFLFVQLARIGAAPGPGVALTRNDEAWPALREAQRRVARLEAVEMATIFDVSDGDIHPPDKIAVATRLSLLARARVYGEDGIEPYGPQVRSIRHEGEDLVVRFDRGAGLHARGGDPREFEVRFADGVFRPVRARVDGETVRLAVGTTPGRYTVRYGWRAHPTANLFNGAGLPATPFLFPEIRSTEPRSASGG